MSRIALLNVLIIGAWVSACVNGNRNISEKSSFQHLNDSFGWALDYYNNGKLKDSIELKRNKKYGWSFYYSEGGELTGQDYYVNNKLKGWSIRYYNNKKIKSERLFFNDSLYGSSLFYFENGNLLTYNCYDFDGNNRRVKAYDSLGNIVKNYGVTLGQVLTHSKDYTFYKNARIFIELMVSTPPNEKINIKLFTFRANKLVDSVDGKIVFNTVFYERKASNIGQFKIVWTAKSIDTVANIIKLDTIVTKYKVVE